MKEIKNYDARKYETEAYKKLAEGIYETMDEDDEALYVTSLSFVQEPELGEGENAADISQYPLEDILDKFYYDVEKWTNEFYRVAGYIYMIDRVRTEAVYASVLRSIRLGYTVREFLLDLVSDWESHRLTF